MPVDMNLDELFLTYIFIKGGACCIHGCISLILQLNENGCHMS